jgi:prephenate dehydratase
LRELPNVTTDVVYDTAGSVKMVKEQGDPTVAGIASRRAAEVYGMQVLAEGIEDDAANFTRFLAIAPQPVVPEGAAKTSIVFAMRNAPGALFKAMSVFALRDIDLTKIESRPLVGKVWEYLFYVDLAGSTAEPHVQRALDNLAEYTSLLRVLGSYPRHPLALEETAPARLIQPDRLYEWPCPFTTELLRWPTRAHCLP